MPVDLLKPFIHSDAVLRDQESTNNTEVVNMSVSIFKKLYFFMGIFKNISQATKSKEFIHCELDPVPGFQLYGSLIEKCW